MRNRCLSAASILAMLLAVSCADSPTTPGGSTTVTTPALTSPANGVVIAASAQPVSLRIKNALVTNADAEVTYTFEVAADSAFATIVTTKTVPQGTGETTAQLDPLTPGRDYYWRVRTTGDDTVGVNSAPLRFSIGSPVTLSAPVAVSPGVGEGVAQRPTFTVNNVTRTGPAGAIFYRFEVSSSAAFTALVASGTVAEGKGVTSFTPTADLAMDSSYFWRVQATDPSNNATSPFSIARAFSTVITIDLQRVNYQRFVNIADWPVTNRIIAVDQDGGDGHMCINHEKRGQWPTVDFEHNPLVPVEATQWYFARINGQWYGGAGEWLRPNQICKEGQKSADIGKDGTWGGPMDTWVPKRGELVGYAISTPARAWPDQATIDQRSNVVVQPWVVNGISTPAGGGGATR